MLNEGLNQKKSEKFCLSLMRRVDRLYTVIHKRQKTSAKVLPSATVNE